MSAAVGASGANGAPGRPRCPTSRRGPAPSRRSPRRSPRGHPPWTGCELGCQPERHVPQERPVVGLPLRVELAQCVGKALAVVLDGEVGVRDDDRRQGRRRARRPRGHGLDRHPLRERSLDDSGGVPVEGHVAEAPQQRAVSSGQSAADPGHESLAGQRDVRGERRGQSGRHRVRGRAVHRPVVGISASSSRAPRASSPPRTTSSPAGPSTAPADATRPCSDVPQSVPGPREKDAPRPRARSGTRPRQAAVPGRRGSPPPRPARRPAVRVVAQRIDPVEEAAPRTCSRARDLPPPRGDRRAGRDPREPSARLAARTTPMPRTARSCGYPARSSADVYSVASTSATGPVPPPRADGRPSAEATSWGSALVRPEVAVPQRLQQRPRMPRRAEAAEKRVGERRPSRRDGSACRGALVPLRRRQGCEVVGQGPPSPGEFQVSPAGQLGGEVGDHPVGVAAGAAAPDHRAASRRAPAPSPPRRPPSPPAAPCAASGGSPRRPRPPRRSPGRRGRRS